MLRVTRLHLLIALIGIGCLLFGTLTWLGENEDLNGREALQEARDTQVAQRQRLHKVSDQGGQALGRLQQDVRQSLATIGEAYRPLRRQYGDIPPISRPLRAAKKFQAQGHSEEAMMAAHESWSALKTFRLKVGAVSQTYQVRRGDTLWRIASTHSPVHDGAGWVTIWKANQPLVRNFDRIEVGWTLSIPPQRAEYVMPFWKPR